MSKHKKYTPEEKIKIVKEYLSGKSSLKDIGQRLGYASINGYPRCFKRWVALYRHHGEMAFYKTKGFIILGWNGKACSLTACLAASVKNAVKLFQD